MSNPDSLNSSDHIPPNLTEPFSQVLCVSDSDETLSEEGDNTVSPSPRNTEQQAVVDLTRMSNELSSTRSGSKTSENTPRSLIEISDSVNSTPTLNCSTFNSDPSRMSTCARARLNNFFDNIPNSVSEISMAKPDKLDKIAESQLSEGRFMHSLCEDSEEVSVDVTQSFDKASSGSNKYQSEEHYPNMKNWNVNISAKIKIKVHVSEISSESSSESEQETEQTRQSKENPRSCNQEIQRAERFIDDDMMAILTEIYGQTWRTSKILPLCQPRLKTYDDDRKNHYPFNRGKVSFLQSLDEKTPLNMCSAEALKFRTHYNSTKDKLMFHLYELYNRNIFENKLDLQCTWNKKLTCTAGRCFNIKKNGERSCRIELSDKVLTCAERMRSTLVHEMCHAAAWMFNAENGHGKHWKSWTHRARRAFPELPSITVCHQYEIEYKYTYQCVLCKARYNAHTRSKKTENIRCAYCHGQIELFLNKKNKNGETIATPVKKAKGFAAFVKETYKQVRKNESNHAATMRILGEKFAGLNTEEKNQYV
ncbi:germ cell nuclear acidic protein-like isoform X2 [Ochlerotatus camptorhynchus]|uniref:germ cell nuclear acidic protein-like isoform X2 n=1 Tax=Ochlerotatus camptorhynchus TaxID=644619 RepID=UPI0031D68454